MAREEAPVAEIIQLGDLPDCEKCTEPSKRICGRTIDLEGPGKAGVVYDCDNLPCKRKCNVHVSYLIREVISNAPK